MLKLIPREEANGKNKNHGQNGRHTKIKSPPSPNPHHYCFEVTDQHGKLKRICVQMIKYVKGTKHSTQEISEMIHGLQESILCLEKQKTKILWSKKKK